MSRSTAAPSLHLGILWRWVVNCRSRPLYTPERNPATRWIGGWAGPRAGLDASKKIKFFAPNGIRTLDHTVRSLVTVPRSVAVICPLRKRVWYRWNSLFQPTLGDEFYFVPCWPAMNSTYTYAILSADVPSYLWTSAQLTNYPHIL